MILEKQITIYNVHEKHEEKLQGKFSIFTL